jgi:hypothetical protein
MDAKLLLTQSSQETHDMILKVEMDYNDLYIQYQKAANSELIQTKALKENKSVIKTLKNKIIDVEGFIRDFKTFESKFAIDNNKTQKLLELRDKEIVQLKEKAIQLEEQSGEYEKKYA